MKTIFTLLLLSTFAHIVCSEKKDGIRFSHHTSDITTPIRYGTLSAYNHEELIGQTEYTVESSLSEKRCQLKKMYIVHDHRHKGIGSQLLQETFNQLRTYGCSEVTWIVFPYGHNPISEKETINFYKKNGAEFNPYAPLMIKKLD